MSQTAAKVVEFFWDAASPYTYLAATQLAALSKATGAEIRWRPFLLGKAFEASGNRPPVSVPAKGKYLFGDVQLWAKFYKAPFQFPSKFPISSLLPMRVACAALTTTDQGARFGLAIMAAHFGEGRDISDPAVVKAVADGLGLNGDALLAAAQEQAAKDLLRANTDEAIKRGVFGAPTFFVGERMFWGNDRLQLLEAWLKGELR